MSTDPETLFRSPRAAAEVVDSLLAFPDGQMSPSIYETGRVVALAPAAPGHDDRIKFLLAHQRPDGLWGGPEAYALVPTLSAVDALMSTGTGRAAARAGLDALRGWITRYAREEPPDTVAVELIVPALTDAVNRHLPPHEQLDLPGWSTEGLVGLRRLLSSGAEVPAKLLHTLEVVPDLAPALTGIRPIGGLVGASPAATAAWLGGRGSAEFDEVLRRSGGPVPNAIPIANFERAWVVAWLHEAGADIRRVPLPEPDGGVHCGPGLPVDADTTGATLWALALQGQRRPPDALWQFEQTDHFVTWPGESTPSPTTNAHVLEALGAGRDGSPRIDTAMAKVSRWLIGMQHHDGFWVDKWHASPYYATFCCGLALHRFGGPAAVDALVTAVEWVLSTQRSDGSWGHWQGTAEETSYAIRLLLETAPALIRAARPVDGHGDKRIRRAADAARGALLNRADLPHPPLWHDKDLYTPYTIVESAVLAAKHQLRTHATRNPA